MKIRVRSLRQIIKEQLGLLVEAPCTSCGDPKAYVGFNSCECPNPKCRFFSQQQADEVRPKPPAQAKPVSKHYVPGGVSDPDFNEAGCPECGNPDWADHDPQCSEWRCPVCDAKHDDPHMKGCDWRCPICDCTPGAGEEHMTGCDHE